jgi:NCS1 family nucleobase:cation symporter-1
MICDYYLVRKGYLELKELYDGRKSGPYYFTGGFNWRAYVAYICGILINVVGFAGEIGREVPIGATYIYRINFFCGFGVAMGVYWLCCHFFPIPATSKRWMEVGDEIDEIRVAYDSNLSQQEDYDEERSTGGKPRPVDEPKHF